MSQKQNYPENILKLKYQFETGNNLIDYFLVCGCDPSIYYTEKNLFNLSTDKNTNLNNLSKILKPKLITKFPEFDNNNDTIDNEILSYCFPFGFKPYYNDTGKIMEKKFSIILDNNLFSSEYPQKYMTCFLFYESLAQYKDLYDEIIWAKNIKGINNTNNNEENDIKSVNNKKNSLKASQILDNTEESYNENKARKNSFIHKEIKSKYQRTYTRAVEQEDKSLNKYSKTYQYKYYFIPKCICLISIHPYIKLFQEILSLIYKYSLSCQQIPIEKIITNLLIEVPIAPRGLYSINFNLLNSVKTLERSNNNELLLTEIDLRNIYHNINLDIQIEVIKHILLGSKIIFFSKNLNILTEAIITFLFLIFPFKYSYQVTSYLNKNNYIILESISPYFIGINETYNSDFFTKNDIIIKGMDILIVDIDNNSTELLSEDIFPDFPSKLIYNLIKDIKTIEKCEDEENVDENEENEKNIENKIENKIKNENKKGNEDIIYEFNKKYQEAFFDFMCELIKNYEEYINMNYFKKTKDVFTSIETLFNCDQFIKYHHSSDIPFYEKFVKDSQLFSDFIYKRMIPKNNQEIIEILLVNDTLTKIKNKNKFFGKESTDFSDSTDYLKKNKYIVPKPRELTEYEIKLIKKNKNKLTKKGQIILKSKSDNNKNISYNFKYIIFPQLDFDIYCNNDNVNEYFPPPDYTEEIEAINIEVISKSSLGQNMNCSLEMINHLYLSWLEVWAFTFNYNDKKEMPYRFNQMIDILNKVIHHEMNILNLLFDALSRSSQNEMILKLYRKLLDLNINPSAFIYNIISSVVDKTKMRELKDKIKISTIKSNDNFIKYENISKKYNLKRTFSSADDLILNQKIKFETEFSCIICGNKINLLNICKNFSDIKKDILWVPCKCGEYNLPKIKIKSGIEFLRNKKYKTSSLDEIVIHSPYNLKINIKNAVMKNYGKNLIVTDFKSKFKPLFYNFIWYCQIHKLDYEIILPYLKDIEKLRRINFKNNANDIFEIIYEDKYYEENINKIDKYSKNIYERFINKSIIKKIHLNDLEINHEIKLEFIIEKKNENNDLNKLEENEEEEEDSEDNNIENIENNNEKIIHEENDENNLDNINTQEKEEIGEYYIEEDFNEEDNNEENINKEENIKDINKEDNKEEVQEEQNGEEEQIEIEEQKGEVDNKEEKDNKEAEEKEKEENKEEENIEVEEQKEEEEENKEEENIEVEEEKEEEEEKKEEENMEKEEQKEEEEKKEEEEHKEEEKKVEEIVEQKEEEGLNIEMTQKVKEEISKKQKNKEKENKEQNEKLIKEDIKKEIIKSKLNIENKYKNENKINNINNIKPPDLNIELKKIMDIRSQMQKPEEININLKKIEESALKKEPIPEKKINYKLKKVDNIAQSVNSNVNSGEDFLAALKKKLKKVDKKQYNE